MGLTKPDYTDPADIQVLSNNFQKIDDQFGSLSNILSIKKYLIPGDDTTSFINAFTDATNKLLLLEEGKTYNVSQSLTVPQGCRLEGNGSILNMTIATADYGLIVKDNATVNNLTVNVLVSTSATGSAQNQCPIIIGDYGSGVGCSNISLNNLTLSNQRQDGDGIIILGSSTNISITNITFPDSSVMAIPILIHWGGANNPSSGTTHPYGINIKNVKAGRMTGTSLAQAIVYISGAYDISVENVDVVETQRSVVSVFAGDYGFVYAPSNQQPLALQDIHVKNCNARLSHAFGFYVDGMANLATGTPTYDAPVVFENCTTVGDGASTVKEGFSFQNCKGPRVVNGSSQGHSNGLAIGQGVKGLNVFGGKYFNNRNGGAYLSNGTIAPQDITLRDAHFYLNGQDTGVSGVYRAGVFTGNSSRTVIDNCRFGDLTSETSQLYGVRVDASSVDVEVLNSYCFGVASGGTAFSLANGGSYGTVKSFMNCNAASGVNLKGGVTPCPLYTISNSAGVLQRFMIGQNAPTAGTWNKGDVVVNELPGLGTVDRWVCITSGTPGTWLPIQVGTANNIAATPLFVGQVAVVGGIAYMATGTSATTDWKQIS